ncbi:MAG TPA: phosphodiester glycosidase family protein [Polyangia bacterium]|jgi:MYXO-CTERM domain-containing protein
MALRVALLCSVCGLLAPAAGHAGDTWDAPFPGVRHLHRTTADPLEVHALEIDLCQPGVSFRATPPPPDLGSYAGQHTSDFAAAQGVQAAVNAGFYNTATHVPIGLAMGDGARWPGIADGDTTGLVGFGRENQLLLSFPEEVVSSPAPFVRDAVSTMGVLLRGGQVVYDTLIDHFPTRQPRTALGLSADRRTFWLIVVDGRSADSIGVTTAQLGQLLLDLGAWDALNLDGGGSTTMWLDGPGVLNVPSDGTERAVANHLGVFAVDAGDQPSLCCTPAPVPGAESAEFKDVSPTHWGYGAAVALHAAGITAGCSTSPPLFCPDCRLSRAQLAALLVRALGESELRPAAPSFDDVPPSHWAFGFIERLRSLGITQGCSANPPLFCPEESATRAQVAILLARALGLAPLTPGAPTFSDVPATDPAYGWIERLHAECIAGGCAPGRFCPARVITRIEAAAMLQRGFGIGIPARCADDGGVPADASAPDGPAADASGQDAAAAGDAAADAAPPDAAAGGDAAADAAPPPTPDTHVAGACSCKTGAGGRPGWAVALALLGIALRRTRRRTRRRG